MKEIRFSAIVGEGDEDVGLSPLIAELRIQVPTDVLPTDVLNSIEHDFRSAVEWAWARFPVGALAVARYFGDPQPRDPNLPF